jgi:hypothetical protein
MAPFTHVSTDRPSRFSDGTFGVLYAGNSFEIALFETIHHHGQFMARTNEPAGWTSQFREIVLAINARLHDLRSSPAGSRGLLLPDDYGASQALGLQLRTTGSDRIVYPSVRYPGGECVGLFIPTAQIPFKAGISTITGTARPTISIVMLRLARSIGLSEPRQSRFQEARPAPLAQTSGIREIATLSLLVSWFRLLPAKKMRLH